MGSYPPRECGIATFTRDTVDSFDARFDTKSEIVAIDEPGGEMRLYPPEVVARLIQDDRDSYADVAAIVNAHPCQMFNVQHEYGLFGGEDGEWFLDTLAGITKPVVVTLHTVLPEPNDHHRKVAKEICERATAIVVLSQTGKDILIERYGVETEKVRVIHHGVPDVPFRSTDTAKAGFGIGQRMVISTFGLISRGKGLEYAIEAMRTVVKTHPEALYLVLGQTHPVVRRHEGESYRESLVETVEKFGLRNNIQFVDRYLDFPELVEYLQASDIYLTPYLNPVQVVSGTLAYAIGMGKAIVSTPYLYAEELLAHHRGFVIPFRDSFALSEAITALLDEPALRRATERRAYRFGRQMTWPNVSFAYGRLFAELAPIKGPREELATSA
ncbi:MAG: glycosyltransferase family 4 protein [Candidatus Eremiobacteraeota bacterium]|nr:glycosyltransferase family 4 protein [Candidatus Eremiobacteraeota bacterium]MBV8583960.1 glycosyltransferase family 4 protein [Candidatus Eremiobacteraeota bacterium]